MSRSDASDEASLFRRMRNAVSSVWRRLLGDLVASERGLHRYRMAGLAISANVVSKALSFAVVLYSTRVVLENLGAERFGIYSTISSVAVLISFMDLGLSNALVSRVASLHADPAPGTQSTQVITSGIFGLLFVGVAAAALLLVCFALFPLELWFKDAEPGVVAEARKTGYAFAICFGLSLPAQGLYRIYAGLQRGWVAHAVTAIGSVFSLFLVAGCPALDAPMWFYLAATFGVQQLAAGLLVRDLVRRGALNRSRFSMGDLRGLRSDTLVAQGRLFLLIQLGVTVVWGSNQIILSAVVGPAEAGAFSVLQRMFMVVGIPLAILNAPLWAMYADARAHRESEFIRGTLIRSMIMSISLSIFGAALVTVASPVLLGILSNGQVYVSPLTVVTFAAWTVLEATGNAFAMYMNGVGVIRPQAITALIYALASVPLKIAGAYYLGVSGLALVLVMSYILFTVLPFTTIFRRECLAPISVERH